MTQDIDDEEEAEEVDPKALVAAVAKMQKALRQKVDELIKHLPCKIAVLSSILRQARAILAEVNSELRSQQNNRRNRFFLPHFHNMASGDGHIEIGDSRATFAKRCRWTQ